MPRKTKPPTYRKRRLRQGNRAYLTLRDSETGRSKDYNLGPYGTDQSRERYARLIAEWERTGRRLPDTPAAEDDHADSLTVTQLCHAFYESVDGQYSDKHRAAFRIMIRVLRHFHGTTPVASFGPNALRDLRDAMIRTGLGNKKKHRKWSRPMANRFSRMVVGLFKWGVAHELVDARVYEALRTLEPLRFGRTTAPEPEPVKPVDDMFVTAVLPFVRPQVRAMAELQRATGMRPGEVCIMRTRDVDISGPIWIYTPSHHKTAHHGHRRSVYLGPRAREIVKPWLRPELDAHLFQPCEAVADQLEQRHEARVTALSCGNRPGTNRKADPKRKPGDCYTTDTYRRAINRACDQANLAALEKARKDGQKVKPGTRLVPRWNPHQLRHTFATEVRKRHGLEAARILLGHCSALVTEAVYAERDQAAAMKIVEDVG